MRIRASLYGLIAVVSLTSGCACCDNPCWGFRFHPCQHPCQPCGGCCPAYSSPVSAPVVYRAPTVISNGPDCPGCGGTPVMAHPLGYPTSVGSPNFPPIIGNPMPLPGNSNIVPSPMPMNGK